MNLFPPTIESWIEIPDRAKYRPTTRGPNLPAIDLRRSHL